jgi:hypothetical protein
MGMGVSEGVVGNRLGSARRGFGWTKAALAMLAFSAALVMTMLAPWAGAQLYTGSVAGTVTDPSGGSIPSAKIDLLDSEKGFSYSTTTNESGRFLFREVPPGAYAITVEAANFQSQRKDGIKIDINQNISVDFSLKVGSTSEVVSVAADAVHLQTEDATTGQVVNRKFINDLPLIGRSVLDLAYLAPGVVEANECQGCSANNFNSNGSRNATADVLLDGVTSSNFEQNSGVQVPTYLPSVDAVEEFKVQQGSFSAEFGFSGGTIVNVITRSGSNQFHGSVYEFLRNEKLDANDWFANRDGSPRSPLRYNDFGGTVGGPILKNKTFFFFDYEGYRIHSFASATGGVPTAAMRGGDFGELCGLNGGTFVGGQCTAAAGQLWDPYSATKDPVTGDITRGTFIPNNDLATYASPGNPAVNGALFSNPGVAGNLIDPVASKMMQMFPLPTQPINSVGDLANDWFQSGISRSSTNQFDIKIDHRFSEATQLSAKYAHHWDNSHGFACSEFGKADPCSGGPTTGKQNLLSLNLVHTFSPRVVLTLSYGFTRGFVFEQGIQGDFPGLDPVADLGLPSYMDVSGFKQYPQIVINGGYNPAGPGGNIGTQFFSIIREGQDTHHFAGAVSWLRGAHDLKFGAEMRLHRINFVQPGWPAGEFDFSPTTTAQNPLDETSGGDGMASFLTGIGTSGGGNSVYEVPNNVATQNFSFGGFVQDNYKVTPKLTLNLGLRYEVTLPRTERFNRMNSLDPNVTYTLQPSASAPPGTPPLEVTGGEVFVSASDRSNYGVDYKNIQPRFGFAYQTPHGFVVRGGYGIYFSTPRSGAAGTGPWGYQGFDEQTPWITTFQNDGFTPGPRLSDPFPGTGPKLPPGNSLGLLNDLGFSATGPVKQISLRVPYEQSWSFGFQKELPGRVLVDAAYLGKKGTHLYLGGFRNLNHLGPAVEQLSPGDIQTLAQGDAPNSLANYISDPLSELAQPTVRPYRDPNNAIHVPFPQFTNFSGDSPPIANSIYHALQLRFEKPFANGLQFLVTYTVSKSIDDASATDDSISWLGGGLNGSTLAVQDPNNLKPERAVSVFDIPQVLQFSYTYALPVGRGRKFGSSMNPVLNGIVGGWQLNGIWRFDNGRPIVLALDGSISNPIPTYGQRATLTGVLKRNNGSTDSRLNNYFANACDVTSDPSCATSVVMPTADFTMGNAPRTITSVRQPGTRNASMSFFKEFPLGIVREGMRLEFRFEAFNVFNHPHFAGPDTTLGGGGFGQTTSLIASQREVQLGLKVYF